MAIEHQKVSIPWVVLKLVFRVWGHPWCLLFWAVHELTFTSKSFFLMCTRGWEWLGWVRTKLEGLKIRVLEKTRSQVAAWMSF